MLTDSSTRVVLTDETGAPQVRDAVASGLEHSPSVIVNGTSADEGETAFDAFLSGASGTAPAAPPDAETLAVILYTSGSSGKPRGAMLTHRALLANIEQVASLENPPMGPQDIGLGLLPMFHVYGLNAVLGQAARQGARVVLIDGFDPGGLLDLIAAEGVTNLPLAPPVIAAWAGRTDLREKLAGVRTVLSGASSLDPDLAAAFTECSGLFIEEGYGLTETAPVVAVTLASHRERADPPKVGSVGHPLPGVEVRIIETALTPADSIDESAASGDPAQIWVRGANLFSGYWPDGVDGPDDEGWYATGDIGLIDSDGDLMIVDRLRELVIVSGFNVYPSEVEDVIAEVDGVKQVAVVGLPDEETGETVVAFVEASPDLDHALLVESIEARCRTRLARFKQPTRIAIGSGLPRSATGKIEKGRLRALARSEALGLDQR